MTELGILRVENPFVVTKAVDLDDAQIQALWVELPGGADDVAELVRPTTPMPTFLLGAKGSGKTHLMRYHSFELQSLRATQRSVALRDSIAQDGYLGLYVRCSGLNAGRFAGKRQSEEVWHALFAYYVELWLAQHLLSTAMALGLGAHDGDEEELCEQIWQLFDRRPEPTLARLADLVSYIESLQRTLDYEVNNCVLTGTINVSISVTRGRLVFGIPKILAVRYPFLSRVTFVYSIDEFENLSADQQSVINTLVRDRELPTTLRIGARLYGIKTTATDSDQEENLRNSEFEEIHLDSRFRQQKRRYGRFARELITKRFDAARERAFGSVRAREDSIDWSSIFETIDESWSSDEWLKLVGGKQPINRRHFELLAEKLKRIDDSLVQPALLRLANYKYPLIEKVGILIFYQDLNRGVAAQEALDRIGEESSEFVANAHGGGRFASVLDHYKSDLVAQLRRENDGRQYYLGLDSFIAMSSGLPRGLLTILRSAFEWSNFNGEDPLRSHLISKEAQYRGVREASDWFFDNMRKAGDDGLAIQVAIDRLARYFRVSRFADRPAECSLIAFSVEEHQLSAEAKRILKLAESRSFLNRIAGGQKERNSERVTLKFQLNTMLCPRWELPLGRRGALPMSAQLLETIFNVKQEADFETELRAFRERLTAPRFGRGQLGSAETTQKSFI